MLEVNNLSAGYGSVVAAQGLSLQVGAGEAVAILGANGAGKTTAVEAIAGLISKTGGTVMFGGKDISKHRAGAIAKAGLSLVPQWRELFPTFSVQETLEIGANAAGDRKPPELEEIFTLFPKLKERRAQLASSLSGGEQQMLTIGRSLMASPKMIIFDEPSAGLALGIVKTMVASIKAIQERGVSILLVEQNLDIAHAIASRAIVMSAGRVAWTGLMEEAKDSEAVKEAFFA
ncbi:MAG: ABC transporter ATP-binding protein [Pseudomonadota bacterium]